MTEKEKQLLLIDLSARLPYGVIVDYKDSPHDWNNWMISTLHKPEYSQNGSLISVDGDGWISYTKYDGCGLSTGSRPLHLDKNKPYLRQISSMTEEERDEYNIIKCSVCKEDDEDCAGLIDWLNEHHFDYRGLIEKGLALKAPKRMYN